MNPETRINAFIAASLLLFGALLGGFTTYQHFDDRISTLESQMEGQGNVVVNSSYGNALTQVFEQSDQSVVSIRASGETSSEGSGFVYTEKGHIITNYHVVKGADQISVRFTDGSSRNAEIVATDDYTDLAVLKVDKKGLVPLDLANASKIEVGERVAAIGNPFGLRGSMTAGIISQKERRIRAGGGFSIPNVLQTDAAINPGNSGGPLINMDGKVIGVNTAIQTNTGTFSGIGFAISSRTIAEVVPQMIEEKDYKHSWIGITGVNVNPKIAEAMKLENASGFLVQEVIEGGPAENAGIQGGDVQLENNSNIMLGGDVIVGIGDRKVEDINDILDYLLRKTNVGDTIELHIIRDGERQTVNITLQGRPEETGN